MNFEWDDRKSESNIDKHGFDFADAYRVFNLPMVVDLDERDDYGEDRLIGIGMLDGRIVVVIYTETDKASIRITQESSHMKENAMSNTSRTNWAKIDGMTDDDIDTSDIPPLTEEFFSKAKLRMPASSLATVAIGIDPETLAWFQSKGEEAERHMAAALQIYAEAQKKAANLHQSA